MSKLKGIKIEKQNRLHDIQTYDMKNLVFTDVFEADIKGTNPPIKYKKVNIVTKNEKTREVDQPGGEFSLEEDPDMRDTMGDLLFLMDEMFSYGVQEEIDLNTKRVSGYKMSMALDNQDGVSNRQLNTISQIEKIILECKKHLVANRKELKLPKLEMCDLKSMDKIIYVNKDEDGERVPGKSKTISPRLFYTKNGSNINFITKLYHDTDVDEEGNPVEVDPMTYLNKICYIRPVIKVASIHLGSVISIQLKITEAIIRPVKPKASSNTGFLHKRRK